MSAGNALSEVVYRRTTCEWGTDQERLTVRVPAGLVAKAGHVPPDGGTTAEENASVPVRYFSMM